MTTIVVGVTALYAHAALFTRAVMRHRQRHPRVLGITQDRGYCLP
jgi:hypothetical protein